MIETTANYEWVNFEYISDFKIQVLFFFKIFTSICICWALWLQFMIYIMLTKGQKI